MPYDIPPPVGFLELNVQPLTREAFAPFGSVIQNPAPSVTPSPNVSVPANAALVNQGTAFKYLNVTQFQDLYGIAPSKVPAKTVFNMFVCAPRSLMAASNSPASIAGLFGVQILERHPYTSQTFIPMGLSPGGKERTRYLVVVAPTLLGEEPEERFPTPKRSTKSQTGDHGLQDAAVEGEKARALPGNGLPDLTKLRAFWADGSQAVTYAAGTWHAPMVVIGETAVAFTVIQAANGVGIEDCQEVTFLSSGNSVHQPGQATGTKSCSAAIVVRVPRILDSVDQELQMLSRQSSILPSKL